MSNHYQVKQVILMRTDLRNTQGQKVRSGKLMAQAAHAAMMFLTRRLEPAEFGAVRIGSWFRGLFTLDEMTWMKGSFAKIVLAVDSEADLQTLCFRAVQAGLETHVCTDNGTTEFGGVPTVTCAAIGPAKAEEIDLITGHLKPL